MEANEMAKMVKKYFVNSNIQAIGRGLKTVNGKKTETEAIIFSVIEKLQPHQMVNYADLIPREIDGTPTDVMQTGIILALRTNRWRPAPGGVSIGHKSITAGTLGCYVRKQGTDGEWLVLSNNHVLANSNNAAIGDEILQPGPYDNGTLPADKFATLSEFVPITFEEDGDDDDGGCPFAKWPIWMLNMAYKTLKRSHRFKMYKQAFEQEVNLVDCALATPVKPDDVDRNILDIGIPTSTLKEAELNMQVQKSGRTTQLTNGRVDQIEATVKVSYGSAGVAIFYDQIITSNMSQGGDSGSLLLDMEKNPTGLLFAGSNTLTVHNRIQNVVDKLKIEF